MCCFDCFDNFCSFWKNICLAITGFILLMYIGKFIEMDSNPQLFGPPSEFLKTAKFWEPEELFFTAGLGFAFAIVFVLVVIYVTWKIFHKCIYHTNRRISLYLCPTFYLWCCISEQERMTHHLHEREMEREKHQKKFVIQDETEETLYSTNRIEYV
jgi:hypothetical protein